MPARSSAPYAGGVPSHEELTKLAQAPAVAAPAPTLAELEAHADKILATVGLPTLTPVAAPKRSAGWRTLEYAECVAACHAWNERILFDTRLCEAGHWGPDLFAPGHTRWSLHERDMNITFTNLSAEAERHRVPAILYPSRYVTPANRARLDRERDDAAADAAIAARVLEEARLDEFAALL